MSVVGGVLLHALSVIIRLTVFYSHSSEPNFCYFYYLSFVSLYPLSIVKRQEVTNAISGDTLSPINDGELQFNTTNCTIENIKIMQSPFCNK